MSWLVTCGTLASFLPIGHEISIADGDLQCSLRELGGDSLIVIEVVWLCSTVAEEIFQRLHGRAMPKGCLPDAVGLLNEPLTAFIDRIVASASAKDESTHLDVDSRNAASKLHQPRFSSASIASEQGERTMVGWLTRSGLSDGNQQRLVDSGTVSDDASIRVRWAVNLGRCIDASALVVWREGGKAVAYVGSHSKLVAAIDVESGRELWRSEIVDASKPMVGDDAALESTAAISVGP